MMRDWPGVYLDIKLPAPMPPPVRRPHELFLDGLDADVLVVSIDDFDALAVEHPELAHMRPAVVGHFGDGGAPILFRPIE